MGERKESVVTYDAGGGWRPCHYCVNRDSVRVCGVQRDEMEEIGGGGFGCEGGPPESGGCGDWESGSPPPNETKLFVL
jgi:hypothetical protein